MRNLFFSAVFCALCVPAAFGQEVVAGKAAETMNSGGYTYVRVAQGKESAWVAMPEQKVKIGDDVSYTGQFMTDFYSKRLKKNFKKILFSGGPAGAGHGMMGGKVPRSHGQAAPVQAPVKVAKAEGPDAFTVAEIFARRAELAGKPVSVRGKVMKVSLGIMDRNWVHLQDGSGDPKAATHDLLVTTSETPEVGGTLTARGTVVKDKDFGSGYSYSVLIEKGVFKP